MLEKSNPVSLSVLLERIKVELDSLVGMVGDVQTSLTPLLSERVADNATAFRHAQSLDLIWQTLDSLSRVVNLAAQEGASQHAVDIDTIAHGIPLAALSARLRGHQDGPETGDDLDLF